MNTYNLVTKFAAFPCAEPSPIIVFATFFPAVAPALLEWASFGCRDIMKFRLGKGMPCGRMYKAQLAKVIPPAWADTTAKLLKFESAFSRAGQMFLLADLASDTLARWTTFAYQMSGCPEASEGADWQITTGNPHALLPSTATPVGGVITNEKGTPGIATPSGAVVPHGWYFSAEFQIKAKAFRGDQQIGISTWLRKRGPNAYDFPANVYTGGYPGNIVEFLKTGSYMINTQNTDSSGARQYEFTALTDVLAVTTDITATCRASPNPPITTALSPLACLSQLGIQHKEDPAGRNNKPRYPTIIDKFIGENLPKPVHGPPGGLPR